MKKIFKLFLPLFILLLLTGCTNSAKGAVEDYLEKYQTLDESVLNDIDEVVDMENFTDEQKETYKSIFKKQYTDMTYKIVSEEYNGDEATIEVKVTVYDLYKVQEDSIKYLANNQNDFNDELGNYDEKKYISYKLNKMKEVTDRVDYTIEFYVVNTQDGWIVSDLAKTDLEKLHGIYNYGL